jgi:hypothetical protein
MRDKVRNAIAVVGAGWRNLIAVLAAVGASLPW